MKPYELAEQSYDLLKNVLFEVYEKRAPDGLPDDYSNLRHAFIYRHGRNVQGIARDVFFLYSHERYSAAQIAVRSMIESMFCVVASQKVPSFPEEKAIAECVKMIEKVEKLAKTTGEDLSDCVKDYTDLATKIRNQFNVTTNRQWNVFDTAQAGKLQGHYNGQYFLHCGYVHATLTGIISQENNVTLGVSYQSAIAAVIITAGHLAMCLPTDDPQAHVDESARLLGELTKLLQQGVFRVSFQVGEAET